MISVTVWKAIDSPVGKRYDLADWAALVAWLRKPREFANKKDAPGWSPATFRRDRRSLDNVLQVAAFGLDFDHLLPCVGVGDVTRALPPGVRLFVHSTYSHVSYKTPRCRALLSLSRPVDSEEYTRLGRALREYCLGVGLVPDATAGDASRFWFVPSCPPGGTVLTDSEPGEPLDVDTWLGHKAARQTPPPIPVAPPPRRPESDRGPSRLDRAIAYADSVPGAVQGQNGHLTAFVLAKKLVGSPTGGAAGFDLTDSEAMQVMLHWNVKCSPPWEPREYHELARKVRQARGAR